MSKVTAARLFKRCTVTFSFIVVTSLLRAWVIGLLRDVHVSSKLNTLSSDQTVQCQMTVAVGDRFGSVRTKRS